MDILDHELMQQQALLKKYKRRINAARIFMYISIGLSILAFTLLADTISIFHFNLKIELAFEAALLTITLVSYIRPFVSLLPLTIYNIYRFYDLMLADLLLIRGPNSTEVRLFAFFLFVAQSLFLITMLRGTVAAFKYEKAKRSLKKAATV